jgi:hypothetical protein
MLMAPAFLKKMFFSLGARRPPYTGGSKKIIFGVGLKKEKKGKKEKKEKEKKKRARKRNLQERCSQPRL